MSETCKDCRWNDGKRCIRTNTFVYTGGYCNKFSSRTRSTVNTCKDCRWNDKGRCIKTNTFVGTGGYCNKFTPYR